MLITNNKNLGTLQRIRVSSRGRIQYLKFFNLSCKSVFWGSKILFTVLWKFRMLLALIGIGAGMNMASNDIVAKILIISSIGLLIFGGGYRGGNAPRLIFHPPFPDQSL